MRAGITLAAGLLLQVCPSTAAADPERVHFDSPDGVWLSGSYHAGRLHRSPCVLLLHDLGEEQASRSFDPLAKDLHAEGYAVLAFDFRGHGASRSVEPEEFWSPMFVNRLLVKGNPRDEEIAFRDFDPRYYSVLVNDIAAAKAWLDGKNDDRECNSSSLIVMGVGEGAALGAIWANSEWHRHRVRPALAPGLPPRVSSRPEGSNILCAVWLGISPKLGSRTLDWPALVDVPGRRGKVPMAFLHSSRDRLTKDLSRKCADRITAGQKTSY